MNNQVFELVKLLLENEPPSRDRTEIIKFFCLPRNTDVRPMIETSEEIHYGTIKRPSGKDEQDKLNPKLKEEKEAMRDTLKGRL